MAVAERFVLINHREAERSFEMPKPHRVDASGRRPCALRMTALIKRHFWRRSVDPRIAGRSPMSQP
jgi:hypothetical protein